MRWRSRSPRSPPSAGGPAPYEQVVLADGSVQTEDGDLTLPVDRPHRHLAGGNGQAGTCSDVQVGGHGTCG